MVERLFGIETEYAFTALTKEGLPLPRKDLLDQLLELARHRLSHLPDRNGGLFLSNGARFYVDSGLHPEMTTPECTNPWDVVRYVKAGEEILANLATQIESQDGGATQPMLFRCNVDYAGTGSTWGCHESYLHRVHPGMFPKQIVPHLVSRVIYAGAGGFKPLSAGIEFTLSPRVHFIAKVTSGDSTSNRGIFHTKDETLSGDGYHRLHIIFGESLCSETALWLKVGATALVVALIEQGYWPGWRVELRDPLEAVHALAKDTECKLVLDLMDGRRMSAIEIQRHYLAIAEAHAREPFMPTWAEDLCREWRAMLDRLEKAPQSVAKTLDWAMKLALYRQHARRRGLVWESLPHWNHVIARLRGALGTTEYHGKCVTVDFVLGSQSPIRDEVRRLESYLQERGLSWTGLSPFLALREELFEIDTRFGQLGPRGLFAELNEADVVDHRVPAVDRIQEAMVVPPDGSRARVRGEFIRLSAATGAGRYVCDWQAVWDREERRTLDLSEPFEAQEKWRGMTEDEAEIVQADSNMTGVM